MRIPCCRRWIVALGLAVVQPVHAGVAVATESLQLQFSDEGELAEVTICHPRCDDPASRRITLASAEGVVSFERGSPGRWSVTEREVPLERRLEFSASDERLVRWLVPASGYGIVLETEGVGGFAMHAGSSLQPRPAAGFGNWLERVRYVVIGEEGARQFDVDDASVEGASGVWGGFRSRFWAVLVSAEDPSHFAMATAADGPRPRIHLEPSTDTGPLLLYFGPVEPRELAAVDKLLQEIMYGGLWFWLRWICFGLFYLLDWLRDFVPSWGLAVMALSVAVSVLMSPLSRLADRLQQQVHAAEARLAPELARIRKACRGEEQAERILALYRSEGVHPLYSLKSLLGVAIVIPVFIGAFDMLAENVHLMNTPFLWIADLSRPDASAALPFDLPFFGGELNLLPFLMTGLSLVASQLHRPPRQLPELRRRQLRNMTLLAIAFFVLFYTFPAGMVLYWTTNNLVAVGKAIWGRMFPATPSPGH